MSKSYKEEILPDDWAGVNLDYLYVADGKVVRSDIKGTISDLKRDLKKRGISCDVITTCDIYGRAEDLGLLPKKEEKVEKKQPEKPKPPTTPRDPESYLFVGNNRIRFKKIEWYEDDFWNNVIGVCGGSVFEVYGMGYKFSPKAWISDENYGYGFTFKPKKSKIDLSKLKKIEL